MSEAKNAPNAPETPTEVEETVPPSEQPSFGWNAYAEKINGRFAMIGFVLLLLLEVITGQSFWSWIGL